MIDDPELASVDELLREIAELPVEAPAWNSVVDRIAVAPAPTRGGLRVGWSAVIAGLAVALLVAGAGAVSKPVRETVFEPVANLLPWVDDAPEGDSEPVPAPTSDAPASDSDGSEGTGPDTDSHLESDADRTAEPGADGVVTDREVRDPTSSERTVVPDPAAPSPDLDRPIDRITGEELDRLRRERLRRERELARTTTTPTTIAPTSTPAPADTRRDSRPGEEPSETTVGRVDSDRSGDPTDEEPPRD